MCIFIVFAGIVVVGAAAAAGGVAVLIITTGVALHPIGRAAGAPTTSRCMHGITFVHS